MACRMRSEAATSMSAGLLAVPHNLRWDVQDEQCGALKQSLCLTAGKIGKQGSTTSRCPRLITGHAAVAADMHSSKTICGRVTFCIRFRPSFRVQRRGARIGQTLRLTRAVSRDSKQRPKNRRVHSSWPSGAVTRQDHELADACSIILQQAKSRVTGIRCDFVQFP